MWTGVIIVVGIFTMLKIYPMRENKQVMNITPLYLYGINV